jgi:glycosyltransferase involved in cell wall biosynthesis
VSVPWADRGWPDALRWLERESSNWTNRRVLLQYTALSWSRRGFPLGALRVLRLLRRHGVQCTVVFHDASAFSGSRMRDGVRRAVQVWTLRNLLRQAAHSVFTTPPKSIGWLPAGSAHAAFIPIGANVPECRARRVFDAARQPKIVAVFSVTGGAAQALEVADIASAVRLARQRVGAIRLEVFGRGATEAEGPLRQTLQASDVELRVRGVIPAEEITRTLAASDVSLCVRGETMSNRGTSIAGIACGVPVVGYGRPGNDAAIDAAGVHLAPWHETDALAGALVEVLTDGDLWTALHERNLRAQEQYFSWDAVAEKYLALHAVNGDRPV